MNILQSKIIPAVPGVYRFLNEKGAILYIGKAKNLKNRLKQYFVPRDLGRGPAIEQMVRLATDIEWIETESEIEAVILEAEQIKKLKPKYNVRLKDDKSFLMIKISKEDFPIISLERFKNVDLKDKNAFYFGPYPAGELLKKSLSFLRKVFPYRDCAKTKFNSYKKKNRSCIYGDIRVCTSPCVGYVNKAEYNRNIKYLKNFLKGRKGEVMKSLEKEMLNYSKNRNFEMAANIRNQLMALKHLSDVAIGLRDDFVEKHEDTFKRIECYDISNIGDKYSVGSMIVFEDGKKSVDEYRKFKIKGEQKSDLERLEEVLMRRFDNDWPFPDLIIIDGGVNHLNVAKKVLDSKKISIPVISISKGPDRSKNDFHYGDLKIAEYFNHTKSLKDIAISARDESHRFAIAYYRTLHRKGIFKN
jgi:excinuclease ABC subunit C